MNRSISNKKLKISSSSPRILVLVSSYMKSIQSLNPQELTKILQLYHLSCERWNQSRTQRKKNLHDFHPKKSKPYLTEEVNYFQEQNI